VSLLRKLIVSLSLSLALLAVASPASAGATVTHTKLRSLLAQGQFESTDASGCVTTLVFVLGSADTTRVAGSPRQTQDFGLVVVSQFDACTDQQLLFGSVETEEPGFSLNPPHTSATVVVDGTLENIVDGKTYPLHTEMTVTQTGKKTNTPSHSKFEGPGIRVLTHTKGVVRPGTATARVTLGGVNLTPLPSTFADIEEVKQGVVQIERP
jgi:hypothetical protein